MSEFEKKVFNFLNTHSGAHSVQEVAKSTDLDESHTEHALKHLVQIGNAIMLKESKDGGYYKAA